MKITHDKYDYLGKILSAFTIDSLTRFNATDNK